MMRLETALDHTVGAQFVRITLDLPQKEILSGFIFPDE
jgi:hypothetical protein